MHRLTCLGNPLMRRALAKVKRAAQLKSAQPGRGLVLLYHGIADVCSDPWLLFVSPARFSEQLEVLRTHCRPLSLAELVRAAAAGRVPARAVAVTFDDGYANNLLAATPLLAQFGIPATVFAVSGAVGAAREFWWDELDRLLLQPGDLPSELRLSVAGEVFTCPLDSATRYDATTAAAHRHWHMGRSHAPTARQHAYRDLWRRLQPLPATAQRATLEELRAWAGIPPRPRPTHRPLTSAELGALAEMDLIDVGAHTVTHPVLAGLPPARQRDEIAGSRTALRDATGGEVAAFSYPFGQERDITPETVALVRDAGFSSACVNRPGSVVQGADPFALPRAFVENWDGDEFARRLARWFGGGS